MKKFTMAAFVAIFAGAPARRCRRWRRRRRGLQAMSWRSRLGRCRFSRSTRS